jgi:hypothetical protein
MTTIEKRYEAAIGYAHRAIGLVEVPSMNVIEWYAGRVKTEPYRNELSRIEAQWLRATSEEQRTRVARDAELLADRIQETLPGAPQDRQRTNLTGGEKPTSTPATSYGQEIERQAGEVWTSIGAVADRAVSLGGAILIGGGLLLAWKALDHFKRRQAGEGAALNRGLTRIANRNAS